MKTHRTVLIAVIVGLALWKLTWADETSKASITVEEIRSDNGDCEIRVSSGPDDEPVIYRINLSRHHRPAADADSPIVKRWESWRYGAFLCFNSNQFTGNEFCKMTDAKVYNPPSLDVEQWIATFEAAGMTYAVLTARHTSGFLLWDSATTQFDVAASGNPTDVVGAYVRRCREHGIEASIYYCLWGGRWNAHPNARAMILAQLHELSTRYGPIPYFWIDMKNWAPENLSTQEIYDALKNANPRTVVIFNQHIQDGREIKYFPTDALNGEMMLPPPAGHVAERMVGKTEHYLPLEMCLTSQNWPAGSIGGMYGKYAWFTYGADRPFAPSRPFPPEFLYRYVKLGYDRGAANVLLSCAPDHSGRIRAEDAEQLIALGQMLRDPAKAPTMPVNLHCEVTASGEWPKNPHLPPSLAVDGDPTTRWGGAPDTKSGWLQFDLGEPKTFARLSIGEAYDRTREFELQVKDGDAWKTIYTGNKIGPCFSATFEPVTARHVRLEITEATDVPTIWEVSLMAK